MVRRTSLAVLSAGILAFGAAVAPAGDWPQLLGPQRDGHAAADERIAESWPDAGPKARWRRPIGRGYAGPVVVGETVVVFHREASRGGSGDEEVIEAIDAASGQTRWRDAHPTRFRPQVGGGDGPLCTPVVHGGRVVTYGATGMLSCHELATGRRLWQRQTHREFDAREGYFGAGSTPLVTGEGEAACVVTLVGGTKGETGIVAVALADGSTRWMATREPAGYSAPIAVSLGGRPHVLAVTRYRCLLLDAADGGVRWEFPFGMRGPTVNAATPVLLPPGDRPRLLVTAAYGIGSVAAAFDVDDATPLWKGVDSLASQYCTPLLVDGLLYGFDGRDDVPPASLVCLDPATGEVRWREQGLGYGTLIEADGKLIAATTDGELLLIRPDPAGLRVLARCRPREATLRGLPALAGGRLYLRDDATLACLELGR